MAQTNPETRTTPLTVPADLIQKVHDYVKIYMAHYDASHDFNHILRVVHHAQQIHLNEPNPLSSRNHDIVTLSAYLHDVGDRKYIKPGEDASTLIQTTLLSLGASEALATTVQEICLGVSYSTEVKDPERVKTLMEKFPELSVVQDADRLDAIGAVGVARCIAYGGATGRGLDDSFEHFWEKLVKLEGMMKTGVGREMARERTERIKMMLGWWEEETKDVREVSVNES